MPLSSLTQNNSITWQQSASNAGGFGNTKQGPDSLNFNLNGIDTTVFNQIYVASFTLAAAAHHDIDCTSLTNLVGEAYTLMHVLTLVVQPVGSQCTVGPGASNGLQIFGGSAVNVIIPAGGLMAFGGPATGYAGVVVDAMHKVITLTNSGGTSLTVDVAILGSTT